MRDHSILFTPADESFIAQIHNMHGPTVYIARSFDELPSLMGEFTRLQAGNSGPYRLVITVGDRSYELTPVDVAVVMR